MLNTEQVNSALHYDRVTRAWRLLLGENLHYGYFRFGNESLAEATESLTEKMFSLIVGSHSDSVVLDVGCGTGRPASVLARNFGYRVVGISPSQACVDNARQFATDKLSSLLTFEIGDAQAMRFDDDTFDLAWVMESSHLILDKEKLFSELFRVLRPGGQVLLCDIIQQRELPLHAVIARRDDFLLLKDVFGRAVMKTAEYYEEQAAAHGFHSVKYLDITNQTAPTFARWNDNANTSREQICEMLGRKAWVDFRRSTEILKNFWDEGVLGYFMLTARKPAQ